MLERTPPIRVLVVDDSGFFRRALTAEIERVPRFKVVGTAADGLSAIAKVRELDPDVVTLDVEMPVMSGIEALRTIVATSASSVIMVSAQTGEGAKVTLEALAAGAIDFIPKTRQAAFIHEKLEAAAASSARRREQRRLGSQRMAAAPAAARPRTARPNGLRRDIKLVAIGSSTGGPQALQTVLGALPKGLPAPIVIAQHMPPNFTAALAKRLDDHCALDVVHAGHGAPLTAGKVYIAPGGSSMRVTANDIRITSDDEHLIYKPSVDVLIASAVAAFGKGVLGILLTGMGADGAKELAALHRLGGHTLAQDQASSVVYGMPRALVEMGGADEVLPLDEIGPRIAGLVGARQA